MLDDPDCAAVVRFDLVNASKLVKFDHEGVGRVQPERLGELNKNLSGSVVIVAQRHDLPSPERKVP